MNQQRSRRFRASKEGMEAAEEKQKIRQEILAKGREGSDLIGSSSTRTTLFDHLSQVSNRAVRALPGEGENKPGEGWICVFQS